jgi:hypothetical protein
MIDLYSYSLATIFIVNLAVILASCEIGRRLGSRKPAQANAHVTALQSAILGLLALILGFTFAMALTRFDARRDAVLNEANAIGTTALRARLLPEPHRTKTLKVLLDYVKIRLDIAQGHVSLAELLATTKRSNALQEALWMEAIAVAEKDKGPVPTGLFIQALNEMIDDQEKRLSAVQNHVPASVLLGLLGLAAIGSGFAAYASALESRQTRWPIYITALVLAGVIFLILDLDRPGYGFIGVSQQPMVDTAASIAEFLGQ